MSEGDFWNNLDSFVEQKNATSPASTTNAPAAGGVKEHEKVGDWLKTIPDPKGKDSKQPPSTPTKTKKPTVSGKEGEKESTPKTTPKKKKKQVSIEDNKRPCKKGASNADKENEKKTFPPRKFNRRSKLRRKRRRRSEPLYFGPLVQCNFNLPRVAQQLERLMGSSVVRLTDRKYMLDLQKRIQEDYHDTLMKRISKRESEEVERQLRIMLNPRHDIQNFSRILFTAQCIVLATELEREQRLGRVGNEKYPKMIAEHPVFLVNNKSNDLLMSKRAKLKTVREKNAEELIKQGKRWERERLMRVEQERQKEISARKDREKQLEDHTLYIFDPDKIDLSGMDLSKIKGRKMTECEIDLKDFLLSERNKKRLEQHTLGSSEDSRKTEGKSQDLGSFDDKAAAASSNGSVEKHVEKKVMIEQPDVQLQVSAEEMKKKQAKKDEDPRITKFKNTESVKEMYELAEELITGDGKKKLLKQIRQLKKSLNLAVIKGAQ